MRLVRPLQVAPSLLIRLFLLFLLASTSAISPSDFTLECDTGYGVSAIRRANSAYQQGRAGSIAVECQRIVQPAAVGNVKCAKLSSVPRCHGQLEGCVGDQWLGGFHVYALGNDSSAVIQQFSLDPICCQSPLVGVESTSCAKERLNVAKEPFEHTIALTGEFVYRGMHCWQQFNAQLATIVDFVWKMEVCQFRPTALPASRSATPSTGNVTFLSQVDGKSAIKVESGEAKCPACTCPHCGIPVCRNGMEPVQVVHKAKHTESCSCDCLCRFHCPGEEE